MAFGLGATIFASANRVVDKTNAASYAPGYTPSATYAFGDGATYYNDISSTATGDSLLSALRSLNSTRRKKTLGYKSGGTSASSSSFVYTDYASVAGADSNGAPYGTSISSFYTYATTTSWNKEHVWPNSHGAGENGSLNSPYIDADVHMARPTVSSENSKRGNSYFVENMNSQSAGWDPKAAGYSEASRGEAARIMMYCVVADSRLSFSDSTSSSTPDAKCGQISTILKWNLQYAVTDREKNRNEGAEYLQGNRNPFIDHPEYGCKIWGNFNSTTQQICAGQSSTTGSVSISSSSKNMIVGGTTTISATSSNASTITWTTSNSSVVSISNDSSNSGSNITLTANAAGEATITAKATIDSTLYTATCTVTVTASGSNTGGYQRIDSISDLSAGDVVLFGCASNNVVAGELSGSYLTSTSATYSGNVITDKGDGVEFTVGGSSGAWTFTTGSNQLKTSANKNVNYSNGTGTWNVTISNGTATIASTTSSYGSLQYNASSPRFTTYTSSQTSIQLYKKVGTTPTPTASITLDKASATINVNGSTTLTATTANGSGDVTWSTNNSNVQLNKTTGSTVTVTGKTAGTSTITATYSGKTAQCTITVNALTPTISLNKTTDSIAVNGTTTLTATTANGSGNVTWSVDNSKVELNTTTGNSVTITGKSAGTSVVTATYSGKTATCTITVTDPSQQNGSEVLDFTAQNYSDQTVVTQLNGTNCSVTLDKGTNTNAPKYFTSNSAVRLYGSNTFTVSSSSKTITKIVITFVSGEGTNEITTDVGSFETDTWEGSSNSVTFTIGGTSGHRRISKITVTYIDGGSEVPTTTYELVTNGLQAGDEVIVAAMSSLSDTTTYVLTNTYASSTPWYLKSATGSVSNNKISYTASMTLWTVGGSSTNGFTFTPDGGENYLRGYNEGTHYSVACLDSTYGSHPNNWSMSFTSGKGYTMNVTESSTSIYLEFSGTSYNTFKGYSSAPTDWYFSFFRKVTVETNPAKEYAQNFLAAFTCDATGTNAPTFTTTWAQLKTAFQTLATPHQNTLTNATANESGTDIEKAVARYDYVVAKYSYEDFMNRNPGNGSNRMSVFKGTSTNNILLILGSISLLGGLTYLAYFLKKRKED